jgi:hypothetical protein
MIPVDLRVRYAVRHSVWLLAIVLACHSSGSQAIRPTPYHSLAEARANMPAGWNGLYVVDGVPLQDSTFLPPDDQIAAVQLVEGSGCSSGKTPTGSACWPVLMITTRRANH